jgi:hypothetical protein
MANSATNERQIRAREAQKKRDRITDELITKQLMSTSDGRRWAWLRLGEAALFLENEDLDPFHMAYAKGARNSGLRLLSDISRFTPHEYIIMTQEATSVKLLEEPVEEPEAENE